MGSQKPGADARATQRKRQRCSGITPPWERQGLGAGGRMDRLCWKRGWQSHGSKPRKSQARTLACDRGVNPGRGSWPALASFSGAGSAVSEGEDF